MKRIVIVLLLVAVALWIWWASRPDPIPVALATVAKGEVESTVANTRAGSVKACQRAALSPSVGGQVSRLLVKAGDRVEQGQLLLELWNNDLEAQLSLAQSEQIAAKAKQQEACLQLASARRELGRLQPLNKRGLVSNEQLDQAQTQVASTKALCHAAEATSSVAISQIAVAQASLERSRLRAPFNGVVAETYGEVGEYVTPMPPGIVTPPAVDLLDDRCIKISAPLDEVDAPKVKLGMPARVTIDAFRDTPFNGVVSRIAPYVLDLEKQARTVEVEVQLKDPAADKVTLLPGYSADIEVVLERVESVLRIPSEALLEENKVYQVVDGVLQKRELQLGLNNWSYTEVKAGLAEGDRLVKSVDRDGLAEGVSVVQESAADD